MIPKHCITLYLNFSFGKKNLHYLLQMIYMHTLAEDFNDFFINKIRNITSVLKENQPEVNSSENIEFPFQMVFRLEDFASSTLDLTIRQVNKVPPQLDPITITLLKQSIEVLATMISHIFNISLK